MIRNELRESLNVYEGSWAEGRFGYPGYDEAEEKGHLRLFRDFLHETARGFEREHLAGHFTGSALVTDPSYERVLLTLHAKLGLWLQLGGHADGDHRLDQVALREAEEESGLHGLVHLPYEGLLDELGIERRSLRPVPFDLDRHEIPARPGEPSHYHYDARYLIVARGGLDFTVTSESRALRWLTLDEARRLTDERSMHRQFDKLEWLSEALAGTTYSLESACHAP